MNDSLNEDPSTTISSKLGEWIEEPNIKKVIRVGPWENKQEFHLVYNWLFGQNADINSKQMACERMTIWKMRRSELTPATIMSTLVMIEMQIKDDLHEINNLSSDDLKIMYSSSFTRFMNYMSSILQTRNLKTMYQTAKELKLPSFIVDIRHLCAHGQSMPDIDLFRRTTNYCINWLKEYYWDHEIKHMENVKAKDIQRVGHTKFDEKICDLFTIYDTISEALVRNCVRVQGAKKYLSSSKYIVIKTYSNICQKKDLKHLLRLCVKKLSSLVKTQDILRGGSQVYLEAFMSMGFFFESAAYRTRTTEEIAVMIEIHQPLFQMMAMNGFIESLFQRLIIICENEYETILRRKGASFWAHQIIKGFIALMKFKYKFKSIITNHRINSKQNSKIKQLKVSKQSLKIYKLLKIDVNTTLIFGDSVSNPWSLYFKRDYIEKKVLNVNEFTVNVIKDCLELVIPPLKKKRQDNLIRLMDIYFVHEDHENQDLSDAEISDEEFENLEEENDDTETLQNVNCIEISDEEKEIVNTNNKQMHTDDTNGEIYTLEHVLGNVIDIQLQENQEEEKYGIWSQVPVSQDWSKCPIGVLPWE